MARSKASQAGPAKKPATRTAGGRAASEDVVAAGEAPSGAAGTGAAAAQDADAAGSTGSHAESWWDAWVGGGDRRGALDSLQQESQAEVEVAVVSADGGGDEVPPPEVEAAQDGDVAREVAQAPDEDAAEGAEAGSESEPGTEVMGRPLFEALSDAERVLGVRVDLAEAVAIVNAERVHSELEKWQMVADERERSLERADLALDTVARAVESAAVVAQVAGDLGAEAVRRRQSEEPSTEPDDVVAGPSRGEPPGERAADAADAAPGAKSNVVEIPVDIRAEARRYAEALRAAERAPKRRTWRNIWR